MKILLKNKTPWKDSDLRQFIRECAKSELPKWEWSGRRWKELHVSIGYTRRPKLAGCSGHAVLNSNRMHVNLPSSCQPDKIDLAHVIAHEMGHLRGFTHPEMRGDPRYRRVGRWRELYAWAEALPLEVKKIPPRKTIDDAGKVAVLETHLARWESKRKRAENAIKKYQRKINYYQKKAVAKA